ncbi:GerMN domain-containing protein [Evansella cellulosilytica]|uniref:Lipoprotein LpqB, GerMN domain n=1 Tax=Evansella cellulosilytica (strain ATCC 21833 / DSM 2522 / FERM P-1141 / JCM 9156 / N-4) TaxID=649639 RepID=E6TV23_EVAC2|nr:GerMN domain-containing protein [Evansella cellulosilytica]ADU28606.1 Lipoprotein LpqB, GerMN domain [Evansella cellulosilytica DSM 2522]
MKKIFFGTLLSFVITLSLSGCGQGEENDNTTPIDRSGADDTEQEIVEDDTTDNLDEGIENEEDNNKEEEEADSQLREDDETATQTDDVEMVDNVVLYFSDDQLMEMYRVNTDVSVPANEEGAKNAYELWTAGPLQENLVSLLPETTTVQSVTFEDDVAYVSFSENILEANLGSSGELMLIEQIALIAKQFGVGKTQILIGGEVHESFLGHMDTSEPFTAGNPEDYEVVE